MGNSSKISPDTIMRNAYAVYPSFAMLAGMQLDVFSPLNGHPMNAESLAKLLDVKATKLSPLLYALVTAGLLTVEDGIFSNTQEADTFLVRDRPEYMGGLNRFYNSLWHASLNTAESIRTDKPQAKFDWSTLPKGELIKYFRGQYPGSLKAGRQIASRIDFAKFRRLLDAGGGTGGLSIGICEAYPNIVGTVIDLPSVAVISDHFISKAGMSDRITTKSLDLIDTAPDGTYDVAVLRATIQVMPPKHAIRVLKNISKVMEPGGYIYIIGCILDNTHLSPPASIAFSLVFLNVYDEGGAYTEKQHYDWLIEAGFTDVSIEHKVMSDGLGIVAARKPFDA